MFIVNNIQDFLFLKPKGYYRISRQGDMILVVVCAPGEPEEVYACGSMGLANQMRQHLTDAGMTGYVEGAL